jgi:hypothetical protein
MKAMPQKAVSGPALVEMALLDFASNRSARFMKCPDATDKTTQRPACQSGPQSANHFRPTQNNSRNTKKLSISQSRDRAE